MKIKKFEEIKAWQEGRKLTNLIYEICKTDLFYKDYGLRDQIQRASVSIISNTCPVKSERCIDQRDVLHREKYLKSSYGKRYIKNRLKYYLGSN